jgi:protease-4
MIGRLIVAIINAFIGLRNLWRRLWRRRVDVVVMDLSGEVPQFSQKIPLWQRLMKQGEDTVSVQELRKRFAQIAADPNTRGVLLRIQGLETGWATLQSVRDEIAYLRSRGKQVWAYVISGDTPSMFVASAADKILIPPPSMLMMMGFYHETQFLKDAFAKIGLSFEVESVSPYKAAGEAYIRSEMSPENREQLERLLDGRYETLVSTLSESRNISPERVKHLIDSAPLSAEQALQAGLVDAVVYDDQLAAYFTVNGEEPIIEEWEEARGALRIQPRKFRSKIVGVVTVEGTIMQGKNRNVPIPLPMFGGQQAGSESVIQALRTAEKNPRLAALIVYVDSPGGDAFASDLMWREVYRVRQKLPVVVAMGDAAASGGYYIAAGASGIVAQPMTLTGSIGVVMMRPIIAGMLDKLDVNVERIRRGERSGLLSISNVPSDEERQALRNIMFNTYDQFKQRVIESRKLSEEQLEPIAGGRVWLGDTAKELGLVDRLGGITTALTYAQELAGLPVDRTAPMLVIRSKDEALQPEPFPVASPAALKYEVAQALQPRIAAIAPFELP